MSEIFPTALRGTCVGCGVGMELSHPNGIGGEDQGWPCLVCGSMVHMRGSNYIESATAPGVDDQPLGGITS